MSAARVERRLTAILAADVAGYSRLMSVVCMKTFTRFLKIMKLTALAGLVVVATEELLALPRPPFCVRALCNQPCRSSFQSFKRQATIAS